MYQYRLGHTVDLTIFTSIKPIRSLAASCVIYSRSEHRRRFFISLNILDVAPEVNVVLSCGGTGANFIFFVFQASGWKCAQGETPTIGYILFFIPLLPTCLSLASLQTPSSAFLSASYARLKMAPALQPRTKVQ